MKKPRFAAIGGHHSAKATTVEWGTPPAIIAALGPFDLDPCAPIEQPFPTAARRYTMLDDGLLMPWRDEAGRKLRTWLNPPYSNGEIEKWLGKLALHDFGTALIFARTETDAFFRYVWECASALLFMRGRINFHVIEPFSVIKTKRTYLAGDEGVGNAGAPTVLCAYGSYDMDVLAECGIDGHFVPLRLPRSVLVAALQPTWTQAVVAWMLDRPGPVALADLYRAFAAHAKAAGNNNVDAKIRQVLQQGPFRRIARGQYEVVR